MKRKVKSVKDVKTCGIEQKTAIILLFVLKYNIVRIFILISLYIMPLSYYYRPFGEKLALDPASGFAPAGKERTLCKCVEQE